MNRGYTLWSSVSCCIPLLVLTALLLLLVLVLCRELYIVSLPHPEVDLSREKH